MKYTDLVLKHPIFLEYMERIQMLEKDRIYCCHGIEHGMDVSRLAWIYYLEDMIEEESSLRLVKTEQKDLFYLSGLLHDIGRTDQYETGIHHSIAGVKITKQILQDIQVPDDWVKPILEVVSEHSNGTFDKNCKSVEYYIMKADHDSRLCFACQARESCKWAENEMNMTVIS